MKKITERMIDEEIAKMELNMAGWSKRKINSKRAEIYNILYERERIRYNSLTEKEKRLEAVRAGVESGIKEAKHWIGQLTKPYDNNTVTIHAIDHKEALNPLGEKS